MRNETRDIKVQSLHPSIGATVHGVNLSQPLEAATIDAINSAWMKHIVLVFPDQPISDDALVAFGEQFGDLEIHPSLAHRASRNREIYRVSNLDEKGDFISPDNTAWQYVSQSWRWHSDSSFREVPSNGSILHGIEITNEGGNTRFANLYDAYHALSADMKARIDPLWVIHDHENILDLAHGRKRRPADGAYEDMPPVRHPLVRLHPVTKRRCLFLSPHTMARVEGLSENDGRTLLDEIIAHATEDRFVYRHVWTKDDVIMWDNRSTMHAVEPFDNRTVRRIMHRVTLVGEERPIPAV
jgi:alpha-ketoglutarate-dependent taurine dioxygenase